MKLVKVDVIGAQTLQRRVDRRVHMLGTPILTASRMTDIERSSSRSSGLYPHDMPVQPRPMAPTNGPAGPSVRVGRENSPTEKD